MRTVYSLLSMIMTSFTLNFTSTANAFPLVPDVKQTPGDLCDTRNHDFAGYRFKEKTPICRRDVSYELKQKVYSKYGIPKNCRREYTIDHFIPLSMGGSNHERNLWPEHRKIKQTRFELEQNLFDQVTDGLMAPPQAYEIIRTQKMNPQISDTNDPCMERTSPPKYP